MARLGDYIEQINGVSYKPEDVRNSNDRNAVPILRANNIFDDKINFEDLVFVDGKRVSGKQLIKKDDILICASSGSKNLVGKAAQAEEDINMAFGAFCKVVRVKGTANPKYIGYYFLSPKYRENISNLSRGANINNIKSEHISELDIDIPSLDEQAVAVKKIGKVIDLIDIRKQQLNKMDELIKSRFIEMFEDNIINPYNWEKKKLGDVCDVRDGTHDSPEYFSKGYPLVTSKNVSDGKIDLTDCNLISEIDYEKINQRSKVEKGDIIMPMIGTVGNPVIVDIEPNFAIKNVALVKFFEGTTVSNVYIKNLLKSDYFDRAVVNKIRGGTQKFISLGDIRNLEILLPPLGLQNRFTDFVEQVEKSESAVKKSLEQLETLKKSLMQEYFE